MIRKAKKVIVCAIIVAVLGVMYNRWGILFIHDRCIGQIELTDEIDEVIANDAYGLSRAHYPVVNVATLRLIDRDTAEKYKSGYIMVTVGEKITSIKYRNCKKSKSGIIVPDITYASGKSDIVYIYEVHPLNNNVSFDAPEWIQVSI